MLIPPDAGDAADLAAAVEAVDRQPTWRLLADWNRDGGWDHDLSDLTAWVQRITTDRSTTGDLPEEATLVEGHTSAQLTATLGGDREVGGYNAIDVFGPYRGSSPLALMPLVGVPVTLDVGFAGTVWTRVFTGQIRNLVPDSGQRTVELSALDRADLLRAAITLPAYASARLHYLQVGDRWAANPQAVVDYVLRRNGIHASPPAHADARMACTGHGWLAAEVGRNAVPRVAGGSEPTPGESAWVSDPGHPFGMLAVRGSWFNGVYQEFFAEEPFTPLGGTGLGVCAWVKIGDDMGVAAGTRDLFEVIPLVDHDAWRYQLYIRDDGALGGVIDIGGVNNGFAQAISTPTAWMYVGIHFQHNRDGTTTIRFRQNGSTSSGNVTTPALTATVAPRLQCTAWAWVPWSNLQVWFDHDPPSGAWPGETHTPQATLGEGLTALTHLPDVVGQESLEVLKAVVGAEFGLFGFSETGDPTFSNRTASADPTTVDREIRADTDLLDLAATVSADTVRNVVSTETTSGYLRFPVVIAESSEVEEWQTPVGVWSYEVPIPHGTIGRADVEVPRVDDVSWSDAVTRGFVAVRADSPTTEITSGVNVTFTMIADRMGLLTVRNLSEWPLQFATTSGSPALRVSGWGLVTEPAEISRATSGGSVDVYGERVYTVTSDDWRQDPASYAEIAGGLVGTLANPLPVIPAVPIPGDPRAQVGDVARLVDDQGQGRFRVYITAVSHQLDSSGYRTEVAARPVAPPGLGILTDTELGLLDDTLVLAP